MSEPKGKRCAKCSEVKPLEEFGRRRRCGRHSYCKACVREAASQRRAAAPDVRREADRRRYADAPDAQREANRRWRAANQEATREADHERYAGRREAVFGHYGTACACCGTAERLSIDHVNGDGAAHRAAIGTTSGALYRWLIANGFPDGFQVLCRSCNQSKGSGERCRIAHRPAA